MRPNGSRVLITGAAGGIGSAMAESLAARGAQLALVGRKAEALEELAEGLGGTGANVSTITPPTYWTGPHRTRSSGAGCTRCIERPRHHVLTR